MIKQRGEINNCREVQEAASTALRRQIAAMRSEQEQRSEQHGLVEDLEEMRHNLQQQLPKLQVEVATLQQKLAELDTQEHVTAKATEFQVRLAAVESSQGQAVGKAQELHSRLASSESTVQGLREAQEHLTRLLEKMLKISL